MEEEISAEQAPFHEGEHLEAECQPRRSLDSDCGMPEPPSHRFYILQFLITLLAMVITGVVVWAVMDSRTVQTASSAAVDADSDSGAGSGSDGSKGQDPLPPLEMSEEFPLGLCQGD
eukprot:scaffold11528_cov139-Cylindrotheca_fusiformis.AAC.1